MWLLENVGGAFQGRRLWLRPGKRYLFGRTRAEPGQLVITDKTISRKHLTIEVGRVTEGDGRNCSSRSVVTIEDLNTKIGTVVNGTQIRGQKFVLIQDSNEVKMGRLEDVFRFSFTSKELRADPWTQLRDDLEQLDVKYLADYDTALTTHVVAKKRNTSKGLQALINGKYIVTDGFIAAIVQAARSATATATATAGEPSPLEQDFDACWPDALAYLPPRGDEPSDRPVRTYAPDARRKAIFDGYTFIFYDAKQYENLLPPITNGKGKALLGTVVPGETEVDDFVRYVKGVAGETGLGEFEDGSVGQGVVVVRYLPAKGDHVGWFTQFSTAVSLRLDHRLIDQREFLDAILAVEPGMLRRPLEEEEAVAVAAAAEAEAEAAAQQPASAPSLSRPLQPPSSAAMDVDTARNAAATQPSAAARRARMRRGAASRFKGFDADLDLEDEKSDIFGDAARGASADASQARHDDGMFVSQTPEFGTAAEMATSGTTKKRGPAAVAGEEEDDDDVMDDIAPTAAAVKRRRIEAGVEPVPARATPDRGLGEGEEEDDEEEDENIADDADNNKKSKGQAAGKTKAGSKRGIKESDILDQARRNREAAEKRAADERAQLAELPDDGVDAADIRRLTLVEEATVRAPADTTRSRARDVTDGRWDPRWNGRRNFKKFRRQGDPVGRPVQRVIVELVPAKTKEYGLGDDYWLEGEEQPPHSTSSWRDPTRDRSPSGAVEPMAAPSRRRDRGVGGNNNDDDGADDDDDSVLANDGASAGAGPRRTKRPGVAAAVPATASSGGQRSTGLRKNKDDGVGGGGEDESGSFVDLHVVPDTEPEDGLGSEPEAEAGASVPEPAPDLPRTRAAKRPRRGAAGAGSASSGFGGSNALRIRDSDDDDDDDDDDGLRFKFRSRRK
ncbi:DNA damage response protein [Niveomyces insectorum RCEF 264]|uniref:DNA damage response protein n=1 Tax=Niveomyces insectorum RCEF 264 TaxID=1081102 RepID=A0A167NAU7_9HYPO|nr:DNA damage response protein [Niveomyces insectorum RCEF 264]